jgi:hypothetical protein
VQSPKFIRRKNLFSLRLGLALASAPAAQAVEMSFNDGWRFTKGDDPAMRT